MKNFTFLIGLSWLIYGALFFGYPDWDIGVSLVMAGFTYFAAQGVWQVLRSPLDCNYQEWLGAMVSTWWCVDGSYTAYWSIVNPAVMIREGQWPMSLCLFLLAGFVWSAAEDLRKFPDNLRLAGRVKRVLRLPQRFRLFGLIPITWGSLPDSTKEKQQPKKALRPWDFR